VRVINVRRTPLAIAGGLIILLGSGLTVAQGETVHKVWICHATTSDTNPYEINNVDFASAEYQGHLSHVTDPTHWKSDGTFGGIVHIDGQAKPDIIGVIDAKAAPAECFGTPPTTTTTTPVTTTTTTPVTTTTTTPVTTTTTTTSTTTTPVTTTTAAPVAPSGAVAGVVKNAPVVKGVVKNAPAVKTLAFTGAETVPLGLYGLFTLVLGAVLTVASRRQSAKRARE